MAEAFQPKYERKHHPHFADFEFVGMFFVSHSIGKMIFQIENEREPFYPFSMGTTAYFSAKMHLPRLV